MQDMGRMVHLCLQCTIDVGVYCGAATKPHSPAEIIPSFIAEVASTAVNACLDGYAVTDLEVFDAACDCCNDAGCFMA